MSLDSGARLGPYEIVALIGAGGMGEVYSARDTRLDRTVAIKVLPAEDTADPAASGTSESSLATLREDRRRRFEQEARVVSALNHPHICVLHDIGCEAPAGDARAGAVPPRVPLQFLVMEYLEGQTLADRLWPRKDGAGATPLRLEEALDIAIQVADALSAAHKRGIVHRDLKPANVMLTRGGATGSGAPHAKLLDFGLARLTHGVGGPGGGATQTDATVPKGTVPYMAPEQIEGRETDARTDLFAFGALLYEMLTGSRAFERTSAASTIAAILEYAPPPISRTQPLSPPALDSLVARCLAKDPDQRWDSAHDVAGELRWLRDTNGRAAATTIPTLPSPRHRLSPVLLAAASVALVAAASALIWLFRPAPASTTIAGMSLDIRPAEIGSFGNSFTPGGGRTAIAWSPDGRTLVFSGMRGDGVQLYARRVDDDVAQPIDGTSGGQQPVMSPDGRWVAFWTPAPVPGKPEKIRKVAFGGGPVVDLASDVGLPRGMAWDNAGNLYFAKQWDSRIWVIPAEGTARPVTTLGDGEVAHVLPSLLPGGKVLLFTAKRSLRSWGNEQVVAQTLATGTRKRLLTDAADARYLPSGHLVFLRRGQLMAVPFAPDRLETLANPVAVLDSVAQALTSAGDAHATGAGQFAVSASGALAWIRSPVVDYPNTPLVAVDRHGAVTTLPAPQRPYGFSLRLSPDGRRLAVTTQTIATAGVWVYDLERSSLTPVVMDGEAIWAHWRPKSGRQLLIDHIRNGRGTFMWMASDGSGQAHALMSSEGLWASSLTPDGRQLLLVRDAGNDSDDVAVMNIENGQARIEPLIGAAEKPDNPEISPDGRWLAYMARRSGQWQVYVRPFPGPGAPVPVSVDGGKSPAWNPRGGELFFSSAQTKGGTFFMMAADFSPGPPPRAGTPKRLFEFEAGTLQFRCEPVRCYDVAADGQRFYTVQRKLMAFPAPVSHVNYVSNWFDELRAKVPPR